MLVLSRKKGEGIYIGGVIRLVLVEIRGDKARIGIEAPKDISVYRDEVQHAIDRNDGPQTSSLHRMVDELLQLRAENERLRGLVDKSDPALLSP